VGQIDSQKNISGFTILELLVIILILGIIAIVIIPNVTSIKRNGYLVAANTELQNMRTAANGYLAKDGKWPDNTNLEEFATFYNGDSRSIYYFDNDGTIIGKGLIWKVERSEVSNPWPSTIEFYTDTQRWEKVRTP
jgi:type II secretory pathway pseudopilin PulG